ncbi:unnamed protein product, partial [Ectocarpus sp. 12 AP-2014]
GCHDHTLLTVVLPSSAPLSYFLPLRVSTLAATTNAPFQPRKGPTPTFEHTPLSVSLPLYLRPCDLASRPPTSHSHTSYPGPHRALAPCLPVRDNAHGLVSTRRCRSKPFRASIAC